MKPIQAILVLFLLGIAGLYFNRLRKKTFDRLIIAFFILIGILMVLAPDSTTAIANYLGVGRGADMIMYLGMLTLSFFCLLLYARTRELETSLTELARSIALNQARTPEGTARTPAERPDSQARENSALD